jgi:predicted transglutaminase-like cysteine proteinase
MRPSVIFSVGVAYLLASAGLAFADPSASKEFMRMFGPAQPPLGFVQFCGRMPRECAPGRQDTRPAKRFDASPERFAELVAVNIDVNHEIKPVTDKDLYGEAEYWTIPASQGDCEDYVLLKRKRLIALGWPSSALLITVVRDERGDGHAVLTARTAQGDFILDNKTDEIKIWHSVPYHFVMRQSSLDPREWVSLDPKERIPAMSIAGVRKGR